MGKAKIEISRRGRALKILMLAIAESRSTIVTVALALVLRDVHGWVLGFIVFAWIVNVVDSAWARVARFEHLVDEAKAATTNAGVVVLDEEQTKRLFETHEAATGTEKLQ